MAYPTQIIKALKKSLGAFDFNEAIDKSDNEAKTRMYLVEPFFKTLEFRGGYSDGELQPEFNADYADLKGKKVDYVIQFKGKPEIIIEVKKANLKLTNLHLRQLNEYFHYLKDAKIGVLTNGVDYQFYCRNKDKGGGLHPTPFFTFKFGDSDSGSIDQLAAFYATTIDTKAIIEEAQELFFLESFEEALFKELSNPTREFVKAIYSRMGGSRMSETAEKQVTSLINSISIKSALDRLISEETSKANTGIITTHEELKAYHFIVALLAQNKQIETSSIGYRDLKGKFSILIDDNQKKKICDLYISPTSQRIEIAGEKFEIPDVDSIVKLKKKLTDKAVSLL